MLDRAIAFMRVYSLINLDSTGYLLSEDKVPSIYRDNESPRSITANWHDKKKDHQPDIVRLYGDWPNMAFSARVKERLEGSEQAIGEWSEVHVNDDVLWLFHSTLVVDALDESLSEFKTLPSGRIQSIRVHVFHPDLVPTDRLFDTGDKTESSCSRSVSELVGTLPMPIVWSCRWF